MCSNERSGGAERPGRPMGDGPPPRYHCSFCGKDRDEVEQLIAGPNAVYICNECVALCNAILAEKETLGET